MNAMDGSVNEVFQHFGLTGVTLHKPLNHLNHKQLLKVFLQIVALKISKRNVTLLKI